MGFVQIDKEQDSPIGLDGFVDVVLIYLVALDIAAGANIFRYHPGGLHPANIGIVICYLVKNGHSLIHISFQYLAFRISELHDGIFSIRYFNPVIRARTYSFSIKHAAKLANVMFFRPLIVALHAGPPCQRRCRDGQRQRQAQRQPTGAPSGPERRSPTAIARESTRPAARGRERREDGKLPIERRKHGRSPHGLTARGARPARGLTPAWRRGHHPRHSQGGTERPARSRSPVTRAPAPGSAPHRADWRR